MKFQEPLQEGIFRRRYKRFFAEIEWQGRTITAHVPNTGTLKGCLREDSPCAFSISKDPKRKLPYTLHLVRDGETWVGVNTATPNDLVWEAWQEGKIKNWKKFDAGQREVKLHAKTRLDLVLWQAKPELPVGTAIKPDHFHLHPLHFVEVKNVTMAQKGLALFPDCVSERAQKHVQELIQLQNEGHSTELIFLTQRNDCKLFAPADAIDPAYGRLLREGIKAGVKISIYPCEVTFEGIRLLPKPLALEI